MNVAPNQETVNDTAKLIMHRLIARAISRDPSLVENAKVAHAKIPAHLSGRPFVDEWDTLLRLPTAELCTRLISDSPDMRRLRLSSPFVTAKGVNFTDQALRHRIWRAAKRISIRGTDRINEEGASTQMAVS